MTTLHDITRQQNGSHIRSKIKPNLAKSNGKPGHALSIEITIPDVKVVTTNRATQRLFLSEITSFCCILLRVQDSCETVRRNQQQAD
jgi:hypothetical protein